MKFILFFLLRRFFVKTEYNFRTITITQGLFFVKTSKILLNSVVKITVRRSLFLRVFRAKEIEIFCNTGSVKFFLARDESFPPIAAFPETTALSRSAKLSEELLGAFSETHALGGIFLFSASLLRVSRLLSGEYSERLSALLENLLFNAAGNVNDVLSKLNIFVPRAVAVVAVFVFAAWCFAFVRKLLDLSRFRVFVSGDTALVKCGLLTLYENMLFLNSSAAVREGGVLSLLIDRAPVRMRGVILFPSVRLRTKPEARETRSPKTALLGHCGVPLAIAAFLALICRLEPLRSRELLKTVLLSGIVASLYAAAVFALYMRYSSVSFTENAVSVTSRRSLRLCSVLIPREWIVSVSERRNLLNRTRGNVTVYTRERLRFKIRQIPLHRS